MDGARKAAIHQALNRPAHLQTPIPAVGTLVWYRHVEHGPLTPARVLAVQDPNDTDDHYLWHRVCDERRQPLTDGAGRPIWVPAPDPWPTLTLATDWGPRATREARVDGSPGWLPMMTKGE